MELKIDQEAVQEVVKKAILDQLGDEARQKLIASALDYLLREPEQKGYSAYRQPSPLQQAFNNAIGEATNRIVREVVEADPEIRARIHQKVGEAFTQMEAQAFTYHLGAALGEVLRPNS